MADHGTGMTDGLVECKAMERGRYLTVIDGIKFEVSKSVAEEILFKFTKVLRPYAGYSIFDEIMMNLDAVIDRLVAGAPAEDGRDPGRAEAFTMALAIIRNPHAPDFEGEKERQMVRQQKRANGEDFSETSRVNHKRKERPGTREGEMPETEDVQFECLECNKLWDTEEEAEECEKSDCTCVHCDTEYSSMEEAEDCAAADEEAEEEEAEDADADEEE